TDIYLLSLHDALPILILIVLAILIIPFFLPKSIDVSIEKEFNISSKILFENFNNLNEFSKWEPWSAEFPDAAKEFFAPYQGKNRSEDHTSELQSRENL